MKKVKVLSIAICAIVFMGSCGVHSSLVGNINANTTNVELSKKNFKVVDQVSGKSTATYILGFGGIRNKSLIAKAKLKMLEDANLTGSAKAIVNVTMEDHYTMVVPFFYRKTVTVSAHVVEFTQ